MIQPIERGNTTYIDSPINELKQFIRDTIMELRDELITTSKPEPKVLPLPVEMTKQEIMRRYNIKSNGGFEAWRKRMIEAKSLKMEKTGKHHTYTLTIK